MKRCALSFAFCLLSASATLAQSRSPVEGVWKLTEWTEFGETNTSPQPGLIIFTRGYYSVAILMAPRPDSMPPEAGRNPTDAEKVGYFELWKWFVGNSGSYEVEGSTIVMRPIVAKNPWDMTRQTPQKPAFELEDSDTLWLIPSEEGARSVGLRMKLRRVE
jgi:hypothetical protein